MEHADSLLTAGISRGSSHSLQLEYHGGVVRSDIIVIGYQTATTSAAAAAAAAASHIQPRLQGGAPCLVVITGSHGSRLQRESLRYGRWDDGAGGEPSTIAVTHEWVLLSAPLEAAAAASTSTGARLGLVQEAHQRVLGSTSTSTDRKSVV